MKYFSENSVISRIKILKLFVLVFKIGISYAPARKHIYYRKNDKKNQQIISVVIRTTVAYVLIHYI